MLKKTKKLTGIKSTKSNLKYLKFKQQLVTVNQDIKSCLRTGQTDPCSRTLVHPDFSAVNIWLTDFIFQ